MTLIEYVNKTDPGQFVKIGTQGGGFFFTGRLGDLDIAKHDAKMWESQRMRFRNAIKNLENQSRGRKGKKGSVEEREKCEKSILNASLSINAFTSLPDRQVIDWYKSLIEPADILVLEGNEPGRGDCCRDTDKSFSVCNRGAEELICAIYAYVARDLRANLRAMWELEDAPRRTKADASELLSLKKKTEEAHEWLKDYAFRRLCREERAKYERGKEKAT